MYSQVQDMVTCSYVVAKFLPQAVKLLLLIASLDPEQHGLVRVWHSV